MTKHVNADSILRGNFCDIVKFFQERDLDDVDHLAKRALSIIFKTKDLVQTGDEVDTDPFGANMFASAALESINCSLTTYPFVRDSDFPPEQDEKAVFESAKELVEMAELLYERYLQAFVAGCVDRYTKQFGEPYLNANWTADELIYGDPSNLPVGFDMASMELPGLLELPGSADSVLCGNFCDIINYFRGREVDEMDRLAQRALTIILGTDHLVKGSDVDADLVRANTIARAVLVAISKGDKNYPFVRGTFDGLCYDDLDWLLNWSQGELETAERLLPEALKPRAAKQ